MIDRAAELSDAPDAAPPTRRLTAAPIVLAVLAALAGFTHVWNADIFSHLACGRWMQINGEILDRNLFSVDAERPWVNVHWLFQRSVAELHSLGGFEALTALKAVLAGATMFALAWPLRKRVPAAWLLLAGMLAVFVMTRRVRVRPEAVTLLLLAVNLVLLDATRRDGSPRRLWWLAGAQVLWANMHGLFVLGPAVAAAAVAGDAVDRYVLRRSGAGKLLSRRALLPLAGMLVACFCTPWPLGTVTQPILLWSRISGDVEVYTRGVTEFLPTWQHPGRYPDAIALAALTLLAMAVRVRRTSAVHWLWFAALLVLGVKAQRNLGLLGPVFGYLLMLHGGAIIRAVGERMPAPRPLRVGLTCGAFALAAVAGVGIASEQIFRALELPWRFGADLQQNTYATGAAEYLERSQLEGDVFCTRFGDAGPFMFHAWEPSVGMRWRVYMDGRLEAHTLEHFRRFNALRDRLVSGKVDHIDWPDDVRFVFVNRRDGRTLSALSTSPEYRLLHASAAGALFARTLRSGLRPLPESNLDVLDRPLADDPTVAGAYLQGLPFAQRSWWRANAPSNYYPLGEVLLYLGNYDTQPSPAPAVRQRCARLAVKYLEGARREGLLPAYILNGMAGRAHLQMYVHATMSGSPQSTEQPNLQRAVDLLGQIDYSRLDDEGVRTFAVQRLVAMMLAGRTDEARRFLLHVLETLPADVPPGDVPGLSHLARRLTQSAR